MRYKLLPYLYTAMHSAHSSGAPLMRPLWMNFPADAGSQSNDRWVLAGRAGQARHSFIPVLCTHHPVPCMAGQAILAAPPLAPPCLATPASQPLRGAGSSWWAIPCW